MDRDRATEVLGLAPNASRAEVQSAFRTRVRAAHPDTGQRVDIDIDTLRAARDLLVSEPLPAAVSAATGDARPARSRTVSAHPNGPEPTMSHNRRDGFRVVWSLVLGVLGLVALAVVVIIAAAVATSGRPADSPATTAEAECLVVGATVEQASCDLDGAQRVIAELPGRQTCPAGSGTLIADSTTWCLEPIEP